MAKQVFVCNLAYAAGEDDVRRAFEDRDVQVDSVRVMRDQDTNRSRGYGFVNLDERTDVHHVIERMSGVSILDRVIRVEQARGASVRQKN